MSISCSQNSIKEALHWYKNGAKLFIGGKFVKGKGEIFNCVNPSDEAELCHYSMASRDDVENAVQAAKKTFYSKEWQELTRLQRSDMLYAIAKVLRDHANELAVIESLANGKTYSESLLDDMPDSARVFEYYAGWIDKFESEVLPVEKDFLNYTRREPLGVCALIVPWNFPLLLACWKIAPALAMGNTIVVKPSEYTPFSLIRALELITEKVQLPAGAVNIIMGGKSVGEHLCLHPDVNAISFTGSTAVGREILHNSAKSNLKKVNIELGGKSANIFFDDIDDLDAAISRQYTAMFSHKGEKCSEPTRLLVHQNIYDKVLQGLKDHSKKTVCGSPFQNSTTQGAQCHLGQYSKILDYIEKGKQSKAKLLCGGGRDENLNKGFFIQPTVFYDVDSKSAIAQEEIFGPVLSVISFKNEEQAIQIANDTKYGLAAGLYTSNVSRAHRVAHRLQAGQVFVNRYGCYDFSSPFGGFKESGWGKAMARHSLEEYTQLKSIWIAL